MNMIIMDLQPVNLVEEEGFQHFMKALHPYDDSKLSTSWIQSELLSIYEHTRQKVRMEVSNAKHLVLSAELWISSKDASYLSVTCHFVSGNWELKSYMLGTAHLLGKHTPENIHQELCRIATEWKIKENVQVVVVNIDGMKKANPKAGWTYMPCLGHTLNKVSKEAMDNPDWKALLKKCHNIVAFFQQNGKTLRMAQLSQSSGAEWLPTLTMLEKILKQWPSISKELEQVENLWLNEKERAMLSSAVLALRAIKKFVGEMGQRGYRPVSNIIPLLDELQSSLGNLEQNGNRVAQRLAGRCNHHTGNIKLNLLFTVSTALDPRFKSSVLQTPLAEQNRARIMDEMHRQGSGTTANCNNREYDGVVSYGDLALKRYSTEKDMPGFPNPLVFWATRYDLIELASVARKYLTVVSTAIPVERILDLEKSQLFFNRRRCIELQNVNMMLFLNSNRPEI